MVVICPKCKVKLKVADEKIAAIGTRFKCPKCSTVLLVKRPTLRTKAPDTKKILVGHEDPAVRERIEKVLTAHGYTVVTASDGVEAMVAATKEMPFLMVINVLIPKIYGFEVCKRLKARPDTKDIKVILLAKVYDKNKYRREPETLYSADGYIEEHQIEEVLMEKVEAIRGVAGKGAAPPVSEQEAAPSEKAVTPGPVEQKAPEKAPAVAPPVTEEARIPKQKPEAPSTQKEADVQVERARRLSRTILSDIYLYNKAKVDEAVRSNSFYETFAAELREGLKLYDTRVSAEVRAKGDFFKEAVNNFIEKRRIEIAQKN